MATPGDNQHHTYTIETLPFFKMRAEGGRDFWAIDPPPRFDAAWGYGARLACDWLRLVPEAGDSGPVHENTLRWIAHAQIVRGVAGDGERGAVAGFWSVLGGVIGAVASPSYAAGIEARLLRLERAGRARLVELYGEAAVAAWEAGG